MCYDIDTDARRSCDDFLKSLDITDTAPSILHVHGIHSKPTKIILSKNDYEVAYAQPHPSMPGHGANGASQPSELTLHGSIIHSLWTARTIVFVGVSLTDPYLQCLLRQVTQTLWGWGQTKHFALLGLSSDDAQESKAQAANLLRECGIQAVFYENSDGNHTGLDRLISDADAFLRTGSRSGWLAAANAKLDGDFISNGTIDRSSLLEDLRVFTLAGSGVVIGQPGVGKTHSLRLLQRHLDIEHIPRLCIPVDQLDTCSPEELQSLLGFEGDLVERLRHEIPQSEKPGVLIFDGYDAARGEETRSKLLSLIRRSVQDLKGRWNTIVSVRSFDAKKSRRLLELFPETEVASGTMANKCRQFEIPPLRDDEVGQALAQVPRLRALHDHGTKAFRALLTLPFNLKLIERVLGNGATDQDFSQITSEVQLLELYWDYRVRRATCPENRECILKTASLEMVGSHNLTAPRDRIYKPEVGDAWQGLLSDEVLIEVPDRIVRVAFAHNILFDFAVSVHLLHEEPNRLADFLDKDPTLPLFLRPSLVFHFTRLWLSGRKVFWKNFWSVIDRGGIHLSPVVQVVIHEALEQDDLKPLLDSLRAGQAAGRKAVSFLLRALRVLKSPKESLWSDFLRSLGQHLDMEFAWDAGVIALGIIESQGPDRTQSRRHCGDLGRRMLAWAWESRTSPEHKHWFERFAGIVAIPLVARTYDTEGPEAKRLLMDVGRTVGEAHFPVDCIFRLTNEVTQLMPHDPILVGWIYEQVFGHEEQSDESTSMGGGPVMPLISNRRQDYEMCRYCLIQAYPQFLATDAIQALTAGIRALEAFVQQEHRVSTSMVGEAHGTDATAFAFRDATAHYVEDGSAFWDHSPYPDQELKVADEVFEWLARAAREGRIEDVNRFLNLFGSNARMGFLWSRLLIAGAKHPRVLGPCVWELATAKAVIEASDSEGALIRYLGSAFEFLAESQRRMIEDVIAKLGEASGAEESRYWEARRDRLMEAIPKALLSTDGGKRIKQTLEGEGSRSKTASPVVGSSGWRQVTEEDMWRMQGSTPENPGSARIRDLYRPLKDWVEMNGDEAQIDDLLSAACAVRDCLTVRSDGDPVVLRAAAMHLACFASKALLKTSQPSAQRLHVLRGILIAAANDPEPQPDPTRDAGWNIPSWSPSPRSAAAQALPWLLHLDHGKDVLAALRKLARDPVPSVRYLVACDLWRAMEASPTEVWAIMEHLVAHEENRVVLHEVAISLRQLIPRDKERTLAFIRELLQRVGQDDEGQSSARNALIDMVVDYAVWYGDPWATGELARWQQDALFYSASVATAGRRLIDHIKPQHSATHLRQARSLLLACLEAVATGLGSLLKNPGDHVPDAIQAKWRDLYGVIDGAVMRIRFASDIDPHRRQRTEEPLSDDQRRRFFDEVRPILEKVIDFGKQRETGMLLAPTAHHLMQFFNGVLAYDPQWVLARAAAVVGCSKKFAYNLDSLAMSEAVRLVEAIVADHRDAVQDEDPAKHLLEILDAFVEAGWPEALDLVCRLDEIYR